ncbi:MAG: lipocalin-like domain-containing protein [Abditibacteriaceae bacterium]
MTACGTAAFVIAHAAPVNQTTPSSFQLAVPGYKFSFPKDHGAHPQYQTEWWYYTGHLQSQDGNKFGYELTFFRYALIDKVSPGRSKWAVRDVNFAHFAITDQTHQKYFFCDRMERANMGLAGAEMERPNFLPHIWIDNWQLQFQGKNGSQQQIEASGAAEDDDSQTRMQINLTQRALTQPIINGINGVTQKGPNAGQASHYYSMPRLATSGTLQLGKTQYKVTGQSWLDREFSSKGLDENQSGWDWFSIQLNDGRNLMLYQIRQKDNGIDPHSAGTLSGANLKTAHLTQNDFHIKVLNWWISPYTKSRYPAKWKIDIPKYHLSLELSPTVTDQEMRPRHESAIYWEGSCIVKGTTAGNAYVEMTGYTPM